MSMPKCLPAASNTYLSLSSSYLQSKDSIDLENISAIPNVDDKLINTHVNIEEIHSIVSPILKKFFSESHYNRLNQLCQFIDYYHQLNSQSFYKRTPLQALEIFTPDLEKTMKTTKGGSCYEFIEYITERLPNFVHPNLIPASAPRWLPKYCHKLSHIAAIIIYNNPKKIADTGFILLDPSFELDKPIIIPFKGTSNPITSLGGYDFVFSHEKDTIVGKIRDTSETGEIKEDLCVTYFLKKITNFVDVVIKPLIACTRNISLMTYGDCFENNSEVSIRLDKGIITWGVGAEKKSPVDFDKFLSKEFQFDESFSNNAFLDINQVNLSIEKIVSNKQLLEDLYLEYVAFLKENPRRKEFLMDT